MHEQEEADHEEDPDIKDLRQRIKDVAKKFYKKDQEVMEIMTQCFTVALTRSTAEEMDNLVKMLCEKKAEWKKRITSGSSVTKDSQGLMKIFSMITKISLDKTSVTTAEVLDHVIKVGEGPMTANKKEQGADVKIHDNMKSSDIIDILNQYPSSIVKVKYDKDDYKGSLICDQETELELLEAQAHKKDKKVASKKVNRYIKEVFTNFPDMIFKNLFEPLAITAEGSQRCFMKGIDSENATIYVDANPYQNFHKTFSKIAWMKEEILKGSGLCRRYRESSTMSTDDMVGGDYKATNEEAGKSRLERILGEAHFNKIFNYKDIDAMKDNLIRILSSMEPAIARFTPGNFKPNIYDEESENEDENEDTEDEPEEDSGATKHTEEGRAWGEANLQLRKELLMLLNNLDNNEAYKKYRITTTGNKRIKLNGFPGITQFHHEQNCLAMSILKEAVTKKPDTMNSDQTTKNGTNPEAPLFNFFRVQYNGYPMGALYNQMSNAAHGNDGNFGSGMGLYMFDAATGALVPYHYLSEWKNMKKESIME